MLVGGATLKPSGHLSTMVLRGLRGALNLALIMLRDASLSDSEYEMFQSGRKTRNKATRQRITQALADRFTSNSHKHTDSQSKLI